MKHPFLDQFTPLQKYVEKGLAFEMFLEVSRSFYIWQCSICRSKIAIRLWRDGWLVDSFGLVFSYRSRDRGHQTELRKNYQGGSYPIDAVSMPVWNVSRNLRQLRSQRPHLLTAPSHCAHLAMVNLNLVNRSAYLKPHMMPHLLSLHTRMPFASF